MDCKSVKNCNNLQCYIDILLIQNNERLIFGTMQNF